MRERSSWFSSIHELIREQQENTYAIEAVAVQTHVAEAKNMVRNMLTRDSQILVLDLSQGGANFEAPGVPSELAARVRRYQFGGIQGTRANGEILRYLLGFEPGDSRVTIWDVAANVEKSKLPYPDAFDAFITTGGAAMPSDLRDQNATNRQWLQCAVDALKELQKARVPGLAICLGHQLLAESQGVHAGKKNLQREIGTVEIEPTDAASSVSLLYGFWENGQPSAISASHSQEVLCVPNNAQVVAFNAYSKIQGLAYPLREGATLEEANQADELVVSLQNHPEILGIFLEVIRILRGQAIRDEGIQIDDMVFGNTPEARKMFLNFIQMVARRTQKRS